MKNKTIATRLVGPLQSCLLYEGGDLEEARRVKRDKLNHIRGEQRIEIIEIEYAPDGKQLGFDLIE